MKRSVLDGITHVVWDWNGTLLDDAWLCVEVMNRLLESHGLPLLDPIRYQAVFGFPVRDYYRALGFDFEREPFEVVGTQFIVGYEERQGECSLRTGAREVLAEIGRRGLRQSVLSASQQTRLHGQAEALGVRSVFERLVGLDDHYAGGKLEQGRRWIEQSGARADEVLLVGDTDHDAEVARAMGVRCLLLPGGHQSPERLARCGPAVLASIERLLD